MLTAEHRRQDTGHFSQRAALPIVGKAQTQGRLSLAAKEGIYRSLLSKDDETHTLS